mmetsp:Transcript_145879/g.406313  ORF Transcript_145879/g.406313 Transcript_145879/m.406313 type:complete len:215 (-) Transcript_145879:3-647(-)
MRGLEPGAREQGGLHRQEETRGLLRHPGAEHRAEELLEDDEETPPLGRVVGQGEVEDIARRRLPRGECDPLQHGGQALLILAAREEERKEPQHWHEGVENEFCLGRVGQHRPDLGDVSDALVEDLALARPRELHAPVPAENCLNLRGRPLAEPLPLPRLALLVLPLDEIGAALFCRTAGAIPAVPRQADLVAAAAGVAIEVEHRAALSRVCPPL